VGELVVEHFLPEVLELSLAEEINLLVAAKHPVVDVEHVSLDDELDVLRTLVERGSPL